MSSSLSFSTVEHRDLNPATLRTPLIRKFLVTHWCLSTFLGSSVSLIQTPHLTRLFNFYLLIIHVLDTKGNHHNFARTILLFCNQNPITVRIHIQISIQCFIGLKDSIFDTAFHAVFFGFAARIWIHDGRNGDQVSC